MRAAFKLAFEVVEEAEAGTERIRGGQETNEQAAELGARSALAGADLPLKSSCLDFYFATSKGMHKLNTKKEGEMMQRGEWVNWEDERVDDCGR